MNRVSLIGYLDQDPVFHFTEGGMDVTRFVLDTSSAGQDPCRHHCLAYGPAAINLHTYLVRGSRLAVGGELVYRGAPGRKRPAVVVRAYAHLDGLAGGTLTKPSATGAYAAG